MAIEIVDLPINSMVIFHRLQAEANVLQHHLGISAKFREARQLCSELKSERTDWNLGASERQLGKI